MYLILCSFVLSPFDYLNTKLNQILSLRIIVKYWTLFRFLCPVHIVVGPIIVVGWSCKISSNIDVLECKCVHCPATRNHHPVNRCLCCLLCTLYYLISFDNMLPKIVRWQWPPPDTTHNLSWNSTMFILFIFSVYNNFSYIISIYINMNNSFISISYYLYLWKYLFF